MKNRIRPLQLGAAILLASLVIYPLSVGPAALAVNIAGRPATAEKIGAVFYYPLSKLPEPALGLLDKWKDFCVNLGPPMKKRAY